MKDSELKEHLQALERRILVIYGLGLLVLIGLSLVSNFLMKDQAARQAASMIKRSVARDFRETLYTLNDAELDYFNAVAYFNRDSERLFSLPAGLDLNLINRPSFWQALVYSRIDVGIFFDHEEKNKVGSVLFVFNRFSHTPWAFLIWISFLLGTLPVIRSSRHRLIENYKRDVILREESTRADLARRVRHDIASPLGALRIASRDLTSLSELNSSTIQKSIERISEIAAELELIRLSDIQSVSNEKCVQPITNIIQDIIQEKRMRLAFTRKIAIVTDFEPGAAVIFSEFVASEMRRALSNIIENAIESVESRGRIVIKLWSKSEFVFIEVIDGGQGIAANILSRVTEKGFTSKENGTGLGLFYAEQTVCACDGKLEIESIEGAGTTVRISLPLSVPPGWYTDKINVPRGGTVVILDDQISSQISLQVRLEELKAEGVEFQIKVFQNSEDFIFWHKGQQETSLAQTLYLVDYDLGPGEPTGLDVARELCLSTNAVLVTANFESGDVQRGCVEQNMWLLPKPLVPTIGLNAF